jgi:hypothetical protein
MTNQKKRYSHAGRLFTTWKRAVSKLVRRTREAIMLQPASTIDPTTSRTMSPG